MLKKILIVVVALFVIGGVFDEDDEPGGTAADVGSALVPKAEAEQSPPESSPTPPTAKRAPAAKEPVKREPVKREPAAKEPVEKRPRTYLVSRVVDGDTVELGNGESVRVVGIDTPERGECGYAEATAYMERLVLGKRVRLGMADEDRDRYDRLLRYVDIGRTDAGLKQVERGLGIARYDSRDGYGYHSRENRYIAADKATPNFTCPRPRPKPKPLAAPAGTCAPGYSPCIPPYPPDLDCADVDGPIYVTGSDPHGLDGDGDGVACE